MNHFVNNAFSENLRGSNGAIIYLERTPYFEISGNTFTYNGNLYVSGIVTSLDGFVNSASGLRGITSLGNFASLSSDSVRMLPLIFSNLGLSFVMGDNTADSNPISSGKDLRGTGCASVL